MEVLLIASLLYAALKKGVLDGSTSAKATWTKRRPDRAKKRAARRKRWERSGLLGWSMVQLERLVIGSARFGWDVGAATISGVRTGVPAARSEWRTTWQRNHPEPGPDHESEEDGPGGGPGPVQTIPPDHPDAEAAEPGPWPNTRVPGLLYPDDLASQGPPVDGNGEPWGEPIPLGSSTACLRPGCGGTLRPISGQHHFDADGTAMVGTRCDRPGCGMESSHSWTWDAPDENDEWDEDDGLVPFEPDPVLWTFTPPEEPLNPGPPPADGSTDGAPAPDGTTPSTEGTRMGLREIINQGRGDDGTASSGTRGGVATMARPAGGEAEVDDLATLKRIAAQVVQQHEDSEFMRIIRMCQTLPEGTDFGNRVGKVLAEFAQACVALGKVGDEVAEMAPGVSAIAEHVRGED